LAINGFLESIADGTISGWAFDSDHPDEAVTVEVSVDDRRVMIAEADQHRTDLEAAGMGDGRHHFNVALPKSLVRDGSVISVILSKTGEHIPGSPRTLQIQAPAPAAAAETTTPNPPGLSAAFVDKDAQQRFVRGLANWGKSAFEALPAFIDDALTSNSPTESRRLSSSLQDIVKETCKSFPPIQLPFLADPVCSIIVPAYNQFELTYNCIRSLVETGATDIAEIILADDVSTDAVIFLGSLIANLRVSRNIENLGFLRNCNRAAEMARGRILVFLNNDTIALEGWLQKLVETFDIFPGAGVAGSKLLYDDGVLQEAGGLLWQDGSAWNFGNRGDKKAPEFNYVREVDYVTGASLAIRTDLFRSFGGFDEHYVPAYCEDSDLCLKASNAGWKVLYQPFSELIHLEGKSHGSDVTKGIKAYQVVNSEKLFERWKDYIAGNGPNADRPWMNKDRRWIGRALVIDATTPTPDQDAGSIATYEQMLILRDLGYKISFIPEDNFANVGVPTQRLQAQGIECVYGPYIQSVDEWLEKFGSTLDVIHVYRHNVLSKYLQIFQRRAPQARIIYANADMHHLRMQRQALLTNDDKLKAEAEKVRVIELDLHRKADYSIVTSTYEVELIADEAPGAPVQLLRWITEVVEPNPERQGRDAIAFLGGYQHTPNVDAIDYFMKEIFPTIVKATPEIKLLICGSAMPERFQDYAGPNVEVVGFVPDLTVLFRRCLATVAPLRYGAGFKGKVATSLSYGVPCIGSEIAFEGIGFSDGDGIVTAETPEAYAKAISEVYRDKKRWKELSSKGVSVIDRLYSRNAAVDLWAQMLTKMDLPFRKAALPTLPEHGA
jgi:GT2 family glycosyltransferase/glycosyltransferase involved in cell wall biosynthesis